MTYKYNTGEDVKVGDRIQLNNLQDTPPFMGMVCGPYMGQGWSRSQVRVLWDTDMDCSDAYTYPVSLLIFHKRAGEWEHE